MNGRNWSWPWNPRRTRTGGSPVPACLLGIAVVAAVTLLLGGAAAAVTPAPAPAPAAGPTVSFSTFQLIGNLNIFNPNRVGYVPGSAQPHSDTIAFVGTMDSTKGRLAFFNSSNASFRKAMGQGAMIADFTVTRIEPDRVELTKDSKSTWLAMGQQLRRPPGGEWEPGAGGSLAAEAGSSAGPDNASAPAIPAGADDVVKRLMEKRQQQLKQ
jgi:hypothetical protein